MQLIIFYSAGMLGMTDGFERPHVKARDSLGTHSSYWNADANCIYSSLTALLYLVEPSSAEWDLRSHSGLPFIGKEFHCS